MTILRIVQWQCLFFIFIRSYSSQMNATERHFIHMTSGYSLQSVLRNWDLAMWTMKVGPAHIWKQTLRCEHDLRCCHFPFDALSWYLRFLAFAPLCEVKITFPAPNLKRHDWSYGNLKYSTYKGQLIENKSTFLWWCDCHGVESVQGDTGTGCNRTFCQFERLSRDSGPGRLRPSVHVSGLDQQPDHHRPAGLHLQRSRSAGIRFPPPAAALILDTSLLRLLRVSIESRQRIHCCCAADRVYFQE